MKDEMKIYPNLARLSKIKLKNYDKLEYFIWEKEREDRSGGGGDERRKFASVGKRGMIRTEKAKFLARLKLARIQPRPTTEILFVQLS